MGFSIDLNCDLGESYFDKKIGNDSEILPLISSCNIACGMHGGDPLTIQKTIDLALQNNVNIGAHPSFPDLQNFGRKHMSLSEQELKACLRFQIGAVLEMTKLRGGIVTHIKPHGALYNSAAVDSELAKMIVDVVKEFDGNLILLGMANSEMEFVAKEYNLPFVAEVFADRNYADNGVLVSRDFSNAVIIDEKKVLKRCVKMIKDKVVLSENGKKLNINGQSICVHGDTLNAVNLVRCLNKGLGENGVSVKSF